MIEEITLIQTLVLCVAFAQVVFEYLLKRANERHLIEMRGQPPPETDGLMDSETWTKATDYSLEKSRFASFEDLFLVSSFSSVSSFIFSFVFSEWKADVSAGSISLALRFLGNRISHCASDPKSFFRLANPVLPGRKFGFNKSTKGLWVVDKIKGTILGFGFSSLLLALMIFLYREISSAFEDMWWVWVFVVFFGIQLLLMILWPKFILPLFNKLSPLEEGELKDRLMALSEKTGFKAKAIG